MPNTPQPPAREQRAKKAKKKPLAMDRLLKTIHQLIAVLETQEGRAQVTNADWDHLQRIVRQQRQQLRDQTSLLTKRPNPKKAKRSARRGHRPLVDAREVQQR